MPSVFIFIAFQIARVGGSERLLTVKKSGTLFDSSAGWSFGEGHPLSRSCKKHPFFSIYVGSLFVSIWPSRCSPGTDRVLILHCEIFVTHWARMRSEERRVGKEC